MEIEEMRDALRKGWCEVVFEKVNGETRTLKCTLNPDFIPEEFVPKTNPLSETPQEESRAIIRVFTDIPGWRSFIVNNVISFEKVQ